MRVIKAVKITDWCEDKQRNASRLTRALSETLEKTEIDIGELKDKTECKYSYWMGYKRAMLEVIMAINDTASEH
ncbi:hypothetical protein M0R04_10265 [Candidatus Dojkabacteria bacterium]|jgi:hypothetical protein|nr:hypothetical protein [Candidatus Dojkabacteria bacterium]